MDRVTRPRFVEVRIRVSDPASGFFTAATDTLRLLLSRPISAPAPVSR